MSVIQRAWFGYAILTILAVVASLALSNGSGVGLVIPGDSVENIQGGFWIYLCVLSGWVGMILLFPTFLAIWGASYESRAVWLAYWTVSCIAYLFQITICISLYFAGLWDWSLSNGIIQSIWPSLILAAWWSFDVARAWVYGTWVTVQRITLHIAIVVMVTQAAIFSGSLVVIKLLGGALIFTSLVSFSIAMKRRRAR